MVTGWYERDKIYEIKKGIVIVLIMTMVLSLGIMNEGVYTKAARKPVINKSISVKVGKTATIKIKNVSSLAKITWKVGNKKIIKIQKKSKKKAVDKGLREGTATVTAIYKLKGKNTKLNCKVKVVDKAVIKDTSATATQTNQPTAAPANQSAATAMPEVKKDVLQMYCLRFRLHRLTDRETSR